MRVLALLLLAVVLVAAQQATTGSSGASTNGSPAAPSGPSYIALITTEGCPDWRGLLSKAASGSGIAPGDIQLYAYLGCLVRESSSSGQLQFYVNNDPKGDRARAAANALKGTAGVTKTEVREAPNNIPAPAPKGSSRLSGGAIAGIVIGVLAGVVILVGIAIYCSRSSSGDSAPGGDNPNYSKM